MLNLQIVFQNSDINNLASCYKLSCYKALIGFLDEEAHGDIYYQNLEKVISAAKLGSPWKYLNTFFYSLLIFIADNGNKNTKVSYQALLFFLAFDSLFPYMEDASRFIVELDQEYKILLPKTGVNLRLPKETRYIAKKGKNIELILSDSTKILHTIDDRYTSKSLQVLNFNEDEFLYKQFINQYAQCELIGEKNFDDYISKLNIAINKIEAVDKGWVEILKNIEFVVPMKYVSHDTTKSFTISGIPHLVFLSDCDKPIKLAENLIHESLHDELNMFMNYYELTEQKNILYYSSWRDDPRPIRGLLHAIYVFTGIFSFYSQSLRTNNTFMQCDKDFMLFRYTSIYYELYLAYYQLEQVKIELSPLGSRFIETLNSIYTSSLISDIPLFCPPNILAHINKWIKNNPGYKIHIPPKEFFEKEVLYGEV